MNPFTNTLNRVGYLVWNCALLAWLIALGVIIDATKAEHVGAYWLAFRIAWITVFYAAFLFIQLRRLQNAGFSFWWVLVSLIPFLGTILWVGLFFVPPQRSQAETV